MSNNFEIKKYKDQELNGETKYYYHMTEETYENIKNLNLDLNKEGDSLKREENEDKNIEYSGNKKRIVCSFTKYQGEKSLLEIIEDLKKKNKNISIKEKIKNNEEVCRKIIQNLYYDFFLKKKNLIFSFYNLNWIIIKENENYKYKINPIELYMTLKINFSSGTKLTQSPLKQKYIQEFVCTKGQLKFLGILAKIIINCKFEKNFDLISIPLLISKECKNFLSTCFLNLKYIENLKNLDFLDKKIEFKDFHYDSSTEEISGSSYLHSEIKDEEPKKKNIKENLIIVDNTFSILCLNSFCIKPEEKKTFNKRDKEAIEERKRRKMNLKEEKSLPLDDVILSFLSQEKGSNKEYSIEEILQNNIQEQENTKNDLIKKYLKPIPIYTYPIANK